MIDPAEMLVRSLQRQMPGFRYARKIGCDLGQEAPRLPWMNGDGDPAVRSLAVSEPQLRDPAPYRDAFNHPIRVVGKRSLRQERELAGSPGWNNLGRDFCRWS